MVRRPGQPSFCVANGIRAWRNRHIQDTIYGDNAIALALELDRVFGVLATPDVVSSIVGPGSFDPGHAEADSASSVSTLESTAIAPSGVLVVVICPGDGPVIAPWCLSIVCGPVE